MLKNATFLLLTSALLLAPSRNEAAETPKKPAPKGGMPQIYEKEESGKSFTDVVKIVRTHIDTVEVLFEKHQGIHTVTASESMLRDLRKSQKDKTPVSVKVDDSDRITSVELKKTAPAASEDSYDEKELQQLMKSIKN